MRLLLVEDDTDLGPALRSTLAGRGHAVDLAPDLETAREALALSSFDCVLLDLSLPDGDGIGFIADLRRGGATVPVLVVSARDGAEAVAQALNAGADGYVVKPVALVGLEARLAALLRRPGLAAADHGLANVMLHGSSREVSVAGQTLILPRRELSLLEALLRRPGRVVTRDSLSDALYAFEDEVGANALDAQVSRLRRRLAECGADIEIRTVRGVGYVCVEIPT